MSIKRPNLFGIIEQRSGLNVGVTITHAKTEDTNSTQHFTGTVDYLYVQTVRIKSSYAQHLINLVRVNVVQYLYISASVRINLPIWRTYKIRQSYLGSCYEISLWLSNLLDVLNTVLEPMSVSRRHQPSSIFKWFCRTAAHTHR